MNDLESYELIVVWFNGHTEVEAGIPGTVRRGRRKEKEKEEEEKEVGKSMKKRRRRKEEERKWEGTVAVSHTEFNS